MIGISGERINRKSADSCLLVPMIKGTGCERPSCASLTGKSGSRSPSTIGTNASVPGLRTGTSLNTSLDAERIAAVGTS